MTISSMKITAPLAALLSLQSVSAAAQAESADMIVHHAHILTIDEDRRAIEDGVVVVKGGEIAAIGGEELMDSYVTDNLIDAGGDIVMPGLVNVHNHLSMSAFRGVRSTKPHPTLFNFFFPLEKATLSRDLIRVSARQAAMESALAGVTMVTDMYYHEDEVARAVSEVGIRGVLGETVINFPVVDAPEPYGGFEYAKRFIREWKGHELVTPAVAPHAEYTVTADWIRKARDLAESEGVPYLMHVAESPTEKEMMEDELDVSFDGRSIIQYLEDEGALSDSLVAAHVIYVDENDIAILKKHGVGVSHNPKSNGSHFSPSWRMYKQGLDIGLGTDGPLSVSKMDILDQIAFAKQAAHSYGDPEDDTPFDWIYMATMGGARALDMEDEIGSLEVGKKADMIVVDVDTLNMQPQYNPYYLVAFSAYPSNIRMTIVNGKVIVKDNAIQTVDVEAHKAEWKPITEQVQEFGLSL